MYSSYQLFNITIKCITIFVVDNQWRFNPSDNFADSKGKSTPKKECTFLKTHRYFGFSMCILKLMGSEST